MYFENKALSVMSCNFQDYNWEGHQSFMFFLCLSFLYNRF